MKYELEKIESAIAEVEDKIGYKFNDESLLIQAFVRSSYFPGSGKDNETLEFIGDSVLSTVITRKLAGKYVAPNKLTYEEYRKIKDNANIEFGPGFFPWHTNELNVSQLSDMRIALVRGETLAAIINDTGLSDYLVMGRSDREREVNKNASVQEDLFEAILGAVALDSNWDLEAIERVVDSLIDCESFFENGCLGEQDYEGLLEELEHNNCRRESCRFMFYYEPYFDERDEHPYSCEAEVQYMMIRKTFRGVGKTQEIANMLALKSAYRWSKKALDTINAIEKMIPAFPEDKMVNLLQELWQKGFTPEPQYSFFEVPNPYDSGNPNWKCYCTVGDYSSDAKCATNKKYAKNIAALNVVELMRGNIDSDGVHWDHNSYTTIPDRKSKEN